MNKKVSRADVSGWSCADRKRGDCVNPFGCHCREITSLRAALQAEIDSHAGTVMAFEQYRHNSVTKRPGLELSALRQAIVDNTRDDRMFWLGEILLSVLEKETGFRAEASPA